MLDYAAKRPSQNSGQTQATTTAEILPTARSQKRTPTATDHRSQNSVTADLQGDRAPVHRRLVRLGEIVWLDEGGCRVTMRDRRLL